MFPAILDPGSLIELRVPLGITGLSKYKTYQIKIILTIMHAQSRRRTVVHENNTVAKGNNPCYSEDYERIENDGQSKRSAGSWI